ncbi:MAG: metal-dependent transcriptional regulator [Planctomycetota bacterium]|jgi:DtxR family Mn-dependent transcriptional regulator
MELTDKAEEILETLWVETAEHGNIPDTAVLKDNAAFKNLIKEGYLSLEAEPLLTEKGAKEGRLCVRRHRLAERLLVDVLHVKAGLIHETGCKLEHILHKGLEDNICILLGHPQRCPHGKPIPAGKCCKDRKRKTESLVMPLSELRKGQRGKIAYIHTNDRAMLRKIMAMGALPGLSVILTQRFPSYVFQIGESQFAVDKNVAEQIQVWLSNK